MRWCRPCIFSGVGSIGAEGDRDGLGDVVGLQPGLLGELKNVAELCRHDQTKVCLLANERERSKQPHGYAGFVQAAGGGGQGRRSLGGRSLVELRDVGLEDEGSLRPFGHGATLWLRMQASRLGKPESSYPSSSSSPSATRRASWVRDRTPILR